MHHYLGLWCRFITCSCDIPHIARQTMGAKSQVSASKSAGLATQGDSHLSRSGADRVQQHPLQGLVAALWLPVVYAVCWPLAARMRSRCKGLIQSTLLPLSVACAHSQHCFSLLAEMGVGACRAIRMLQMQCTVAYSHSQQVFYKFSWACLSSTGCLSRTRRPCQDLNGVESGC